jgi:hypothetical protein
MAWMVSNTVTSKLVVVGAWIGIDKQVIGTPTLVIEAKIAFSQPAVGHHYSTQTRTLPSSLLLLTHKAIMNHKIYCTEY